MEGCEWDMELVLYTSINAGLIVAAIYLMKRWTEHRIAQSIKHEYDKKLLKLEHQLIRKDTELEVIMEDRRNHRREQVLPFLQALDKAMSESFVLIVYPPYYRDLGGQIPQLRKHFDQALKDWLSSLKELSEQRVKMLTAIDQSAVDDTHKMIADFYGIVEKLLMER